MFRKHPAAVVSVINDLVTDNRVRRTCDTLVGMGYEVSLIGRRLRHSPPMPPLPYRTVRMRLLFTTGPLFYLFFNLRLFFVLLFSRADLFFANDLDTLLPNHLAARLRGKPLIYDSHELFCDVPELAHSRVKRNIWQAVERFIVPRLRHCITVNGSIARVFNERYGVSFRVVRNIPAPVPGFVPKSRQELGLSPDRKILLLQGAGINVERGAEELVEAMTRVEGALLLIIGSGDVWEMLEKLVAEKKLDDRVWLLKRMPKEKLMHYTHNADIGLSIDKNTSLNYYYSLPNKIFDYLQAGVPILASRLPEIARIVDEYHAGEFIDGHDPSHIAARLREMMNSPALPEYRANALKAAAALSWDNEKAALMEVIRAAGARRAAAAGGQAL